MKLQKYGLAALLFLLTFSGFALAALPTIMDEKDVLPYLERVIAWQRQAAGLETSPELPREMIFKSSLQQHTAQTLHDSIALAQALAAAMPNTPKPVTKDEKEEKVSKEYGIKKAIAGAEQQVQQLQNTLDHATLQPHRDRLTGELKLAQEHLNLLRAIAQTIGISDTGDDTLEHKIDQLAATVPEIENEQKPTAAEASSQLSNLSSGGIFGLATKIYGFIQAKSTVRSLLSDTRALYDENKTRSQTVGDALKNILQQGGVTGGKISEATQASPQPKYDALLSDMKKMSKVALTLSHMNESLTLCTHDLSNWASLISSHIRELLENLFFRLLSLAIAILSAVGLGMLAKQATRRYVLDRNRKNQFRVIRRFLLTITIGLILFLGFFTDLSSLATFAGLLTAGIVFAMRDMVLSLIAYFQFFSSSDIRPGDLVTVSGVTGKITQIGMLRFYVMELEKSELGYFPTGRVVSFSNTVLFQPTPFFRQSPGSNFVWNEINVTLSSTTDPQVAYKKLCDIAIKAYAKHREAIQRHEVALEKITHLKAEFSQPRTYLRITNLGVVFVMRYAVEHNQEYALHLALTEELLAAVRKDPALKAAHIDTQAM